MPFFSIIMPAYNAEKYLDEAIESVLKQSFPDFELIVVNDGSHDHTKDICQRWMKEDARVQFIDKKNAGVAAARNDALDVAKGVFIMFVDSDDVIYPHSLQTLYNVLSKTPYDYLRFEYKTIDELGKSLYLNYEGRKRRKYVGKNMDASLCIQRLVRGEFFSCVGVYKRSVIESHHLRLLKGCTYNEDTLFMMEYFMYSKAHSYINDVIYGYRKTNSAVTAKFTDRNFEDVIRVIEKLIAMDSDRGQIKHEVIKHVAESLCLHLLFSYPEKFCMNAETKMEYCISEPITPEWKTLRLLGLKWGMNFLPVLNFVRKVLRRL